MVVNTSAVGIAGVGGGLSVDRCPLGFLFHGVSGSAVLFSVGQTRERNHGVVSEQAAPAPQPGWRAEVWLSGPSLPLLGRGGGNRFHGLHRGTARSPVWARRSCPPG